MPLYIKRAITQVFLIDAPLQCGELRKGVLTTVKHI